VSALRVLVVDDEELARLRLRGLVDECPLPRANVVGEAANVSQALVWLATQQCDVLLLDIQMPGRDGTQLAAELRGQDRSPAVVGEMARHWPFFATLLSNMDMVLAKTDLAIASRYAELVQDTELRERIFARIAAEYWETQRCLELVTGTSVRLESNPLLARSIQNRFAYLDPLNHLQVELIQRHRAAAGDPDRVDERVHRGIHLSINGVAAGLRNTG